MDTTTEITMDMMTKKCSKKITMGTTMEKTTTMDMIMMNTKKPCSKKITMDTTTEKTTMTGMIMMNKTKTMMDMTMEITKKTTTADIPILLLRFKRKLIIMCIDEVLFLTYFC